ncbi:hypothetical protein Taro_004097, partial [Colocasia esculenta]|nr:hypothetical protein [Colocasia esculenta]
YSTKQSQVRKRERNYTVVGLRYSAEPENPCAPRHHKNPASMSSTSRRSETRTKNNHNCRSLAGLRSHA